MLLLDDGDELPVAPDEEETALMAELGAAGQDSIDAALLKPARNRWQKAARVVLDAIQQGGYPLSDETRIRVYVRRLMALAESGALEAKGNLRKPRWSEVRLPEQR